MTSDVLQIIDDLQRMQTKQQNDADDIGRDSCGYAFEPFDAFSTKPLEFVETAMRLHIEALETFSMLRTLNRHSPLYYRLSGQFEKLLRQLGSCCITKAVIEKQENEPFELLQDLTIDTLREMTAFNFRKCFAAFMDSRCAGKFNTSAFDLSVRWSALDKRLIATDEKIRNQKSEIRNAALKAPDAQYSEPMGTVPEGTDLCRRGKLACQWRKSLQTRLFLPFRKKDGHFRCYRSQWGLYPKAQTCAGGACPHWISLLVITKSPRQRCQTLPTPCGVFRDSPRRHSRQCPVTTGTVPSGTLRCRREKVPIVNLPCGRCC